MTGPTGATGWLDLASRALGGSVVAANDEFFAERENLILPHAPAHDPDAYGHKGKIYDGWETRRRRTTGNDHAVVRLGAAGIVHEVVVDTAHFRGNYPPEIAVEATAAEGYPSPDELDGAEWTALVPRSPAAGDTANSYPVADRHRWTHVRLSIFPDGGVARLRVHGEVVPDPRFLEGTVDLLAAGNGGRVLDCSDAFFSSPANLLLPGSVRRMGEGWENARRRGPGNDHAVFALGVPGVPRYAEVDTSFYVGNAPGEIALHTADGEDTWAPLLDRTRVQPDTVHRFRCDGATRADRLRLDLFPDGGISRLRLFGELDDDARAAARERWWNALPEQHRRRLA